MSAEQSLPHRLDYRRAALDDRHVAGVLSLDALPRTAEAVVPGSRADVAVTLDFNEDSQRRVAVTGRLQTTLSLPCQRCLAPAAVTIDGAIAGMAVASDEAAADVPRDWEPMLADGTTLDVHALVDDELLLALPITVQCDRASCQAEYEQYGSSGDVSDETSQADEKTNPFAALAALKKAGDDDRD